ncbi:MAG TPA: hypothetical protein VJV79_09375, partial [Polyangiaceae bacterium]|nr:hypothetical protein [Polyangiaceae bacterium]
MIATLSRWLEVLVITLTFGACVTAIAIIVLVAVRQGWGAPLPRRRFLPLLWVLGFYFAGWLPTPYVYWALTCALVFLASDFLIVWLLLPLGCVRTTYLIARLAGHTGVPHDARLRAALLAARALLHRPSQQAQRFLERRLMKCGELGALGAAAAALIAHSRGDVAGAESILRGVLSVTGAEEQALLSPALRDIQDQDEPPIGPLANEAAANEPSLNALTALARRLPGGARAQDVAHAASALDALRTSPTWAAQLEARGQELGTAGAAARARVLAQVEGDLAEAALAERWPAIWLGSGPTADAVRVLVQEQRLSTVEHLAAELERRSSEAQALPEAEEWQAWGELLRVSQELERDATTPADRQLHFRAVHRSIWNYGYQQAFVLGRRDLGSVVFSRQRRLAYAADATETYQVIEGNLRAARTQASAAKGEDSAIWYCHQRLVTVWRRLNAISLRGAQVGLVLACLWGFGAGGLGRGTLLVALLL